MIEWIVTSSALILMVIALRFLTKNRISYTLRYALWLIVLVRLLLPVTPFESRLSIMNLAEPRIESSEMIQSLLEIDESTAQYFYFDENNIMNYHPANASWQYALYGIWLIGIFYMLERILSCNIGFHRRLRPIRQPLTNSSAAGSPRIFILPGLDSPCLFGIHRPSIYVTETTAADAKSMQYVLAHERAHYRHGDHIWSLLRLAALTLHWYNPLVWLACALSKKDSELAADAAAVRSLGTAARCEYGCTLINIGQQSGLRRTVFSCTSMVSGLLSPKRALRKRIVAIARNPHTGKFTSMLVLALLLLAAVCTFTGAEGSVITLSSFFPF